MKFQYFSNNDDKDWFISIIVNDYNNDDDNWSKKITVVVTNTVEFKYFDTVDNEFAKLNRFTIPLDVDEVEQFYNAMLKIESVFQMSVLKPLKIEIFDSILHLSYLDYRFKLQLKECESRLSLKVMRQLFYKMEAFAQDQTRLLNVMCTEFDKRQRSAKISSQNNGYATRLANDNKRILFKTSSDIINVQREGHNNTSDLFSEIMEKFWQSDAESGVASRENTVSNDKVCRLPPMLMKGMKLPCKKKARKGNS